MFLNELGVKVLAVSDSKDGIMSKQGLDPSKVQSHKDKTGSVVGLESTQEISNAELLESEVDILIPAALENAITDRNASKVKAKIVCEGANGPTTPEADKILEKNEVLVVPDILANAGGVTVSYLEWVQNLNLEHWTEADVNEKLERKVVSAFKSTFETAKKYNVPMRDGALALAVGRVSEAIRTLGIWP